MREDIMQELYKTFKLSSRQGTGGMIFKYVPNEDVITRMNKVFKGNWSTIVMHKDVIEDQVLVEVQVTITDPDTNENYVQTGFGSSQIVRYSGGPNQNKIIDIGNAYKGSLSKAIVNACTRWGVGLVKESNPYDENDITVVADAPQEMVVPPMVPTMPVSAPTPVPVQPPTTMTPPPTPYIQETAVATNVIPPPATASPVVPPPTVVVETPQVSAPPVIETTTTFSPPIAPNQPVSAHIGLSQEIPKVPVPAADVVPTTPDLPFSKNEGLGDIGISDVQRVALNGILSMNNAAYVTLAQEAFGANGINRAVPNKEDLSYDEAVVVIKFGNDKYRKNR